MIRRLLAVLALLTPSVSHTALAAPQDPFAPGLRWVHQASNTEPWIPSEVSFAHGGERVFAAGLHGHPRLLAFPSASTGLAAPWGADTGFGTNMKVHATAQPARSAELWALVEIPGPSGTQLEARSYPVPNGPVASFVPNRVWALGPNLGGSAKITMDAAGRSVVVATADTTGSVVVRWLGALGGEIVLERTLSLGALGRLEMQADGARVLISGGGEVFVLESATGATLHHEWLAQSTDGVALSGDGFSLALGEFGAVRVLDSNRLTGSFSASWSVLGSSTEIAMRVALDRRGQTLAIAWWDWMAEDAVRFELWDVATQTRVANHDVPTLAGPAGPQNLPSGIAFSRLGKRAVFSTWGDGVRPQIVLLERGATQAIATWAVPGSALDVDLSPGGTRVAVALKSVHANAFGTTGEVRMYDTGERDLVQMAPVASGGNYAVAASRPGASFALFLAGSASRLTREHSLGGGAFGLDRSRPIRVVARAVDANGRANAVITPPAGLVSGERVGLQVLFRGVSGRDLSRTRIIP